MKGFSRLFVAGIAAATLVVSACGSTLPQAQQQAAEVAGDELGNLGSNTLPPGARINKRGQVVSAEGEVLGSAEEFGINRASGGAGAGNTGVAQGTGSAAGSALGVTATTITLGIPVWTDTEAGIEASGLSVSPFDYRRAWEALVDDTNKRGGIAGRRVMPEYHEIRAISNDWPQEAQKACADWTQDHRVFAALVETFEEFGEDFFACMERGGAAVVSGNASDMIFDERVFPRYPHYVAPFAMDLNTQASSLVNGMVKQKYFDKAAKIGLVIYDLPYFDYATEQSFIPALRRHGLELASIARLHRPRGTSEFGQLSNDANNAALKFKTEGITHVMILDSGNAASRFFMQAAERQAYRPRYGLTSQSGGTTGADLLGGAARNQLHGARMIGWWPVSDVRAGDEPAFARSRTRTRCLELMRRRGVAMQDRNAEAQAVAYCDEMWVTKAIIEGGGKTITGDSYIAGIDRLGSSYAPGQTFVAGVSAEMRDGVRAVAPLSFFDECTCFRYTGRPYSIPN